jgi:hypothetical protein
MLVGVYGMTVSGSADAFRPFELVEETSSRKAMSAVGLSRPSPTLASMSAIRG